MREPFFLLILIVSWSSAEDQPEPVKETTVPCASTNQISFDLEEEDGLTGNTVVTTEIGSTTPTVKLTTVEAIHENGSQSEQPGQSNSILEPPSSKCDIKNYVEQSWSSLQKCCNDGCFGCEQKNCPFCSDVMTKCIAAFREKVGGILELGAEVMVKDKLDYQAYNVTISKDCHQQKLSDEKKDEDVKSTEQTTNETAHSPVK